MKFITILLSLGLLAACAPTSQVARGTYEQTTGEALIQQRLALRANADRQARLDRLARPLLRANVDMCGKLVAPKIDLRLVSSQLYQGSFKKAAELEFGIDEKPRLLVAEGGQAAKAGLQNGDILLGVNDTQAKAVLTKRELKRLYTLIDKALVSDGAASRSVSLSVLTKSGENRKITVTAETRCDFPVLVQQNDSLNAFADGSNIILTTGMMRFVREDKELQFILAHELAHNTEGHLDKKRGNYLIGSIFDVLAAAYGVNTQGTFGNAGAGAFSQDFEREADYVGMYFLERAGIDGRNVANFWRKMVAENAGSIQANYNSSHPSSAERYGNIEQAYLEVVQKRQNNEPLLPNRQ